MDKGTLIIRLIKLYNLEATTNNLIELQEINRTILATKEQINELLE